MSSSSFDETLFELLDGSFADVNFNLTAPGSKGVNAFDLSGFIALRFEVHLVFADNVLYNTFC